MSSAIIRDRIVALRRVRAGELLPDKRNWRRHPKAQREALRGMLSEIGYADALLVRETVEGKLILIDGHLRAALDPNQVVPVLVLDLDEIEAGKLLATLDPLAAMAQPDMDALMALLADTSFQSAAVNEMLEALANGETIPLKQFQGQIDSDDVPNMHTESWVRRGDIFQLGEHRVMCGDSTKVEEVQVLLRGTTPLLMLTDPPYGVGYQTDGKILRWRHDNLPIANDDLGADQGEFWHRAFAAWPLNGDCYIFCAPGPLMVVLSQAIIASGISHHQWLIWSKDRFVLGRSHYHNRHEHIFYGWKGKSSWQGRRDEDSVWECPRPQRSPEHPTMKPVALLERALKNSSRQGDAIADPFLGSGATLIASQKLGRICYGMEIEPRYVQVALERWELYTGNKVVKVS